MSKGGFVAFRGSSAVAESYLAGKEQDRDASASAAYLASDDRPFQHGAITADGAEVDAFTREEFRAWAEHVDPETGEVRGSFRTKTTKSIDKDGNLVEKAGGTPLYQETLISSSKSLSLAAAADPRIAEALQEAMERATVKMAEAFHEHAVTRIGSRGKQQQVKLDRIEFTSVQHHTSRTGDPHEHRHVQFLSAALVTLPNGEQAWRAVNSGVLYNLPERLHAAADLSLSTDTELRQAIADAGFTWTPGEGGGKVAEFETLTDAFSQRRDQVAARREALETQWRAQHPGQEPSEKQVRTWDNYGWSSTRPDKHELEAEAKEDQADKLAGVAPTNTERTVTREDADMIDATSVAADALAELAKQHSAWSSADVKAAIDRRLAQTHLIGDTGLKELQDSAFVAARSQLVSFYDEGVDVEGAKQYTLQSVLDTDRAIEASLKRRAQFAGRAGLVEVDRGGFHLTEGQAAAARSITGSHRLVVVEGAAGTGKTTMLSAANEQIAKEGRRIVAVSPTKRGALEMAKEIGVQGNSVHGMLVRAGASFDDHGRWRLPKEWKKQPAELAMDKDTVLVVDEVGMLDMNTAEALHAYCDDTGVQLVLLGDRKQLAAVGRGGYLPKAVHLATQAHDLRDVRRFLTAEKEIDQEYADATLKLRDREDPTEFFDLLQERSQVQLGEPDEVLDRVAETMALEIDADKTSIAIASTNATAQRINHAVYERLVSSRAIKPGLGTVEGRDGDPIAVGAKVATRQNDRELQVANRQTWIVKRVNRDGRVIVADEETGFRTTLDSEYVRENLQLAYAVTAHGSQGMTVDTAHFVLSDQADAAAAYVGLTRGRRANVLHAVAADLDDAKEQFEAAVARSSADQGLDDAQTRAQRSLDGLDAEARPVERSTSLHELRSESSDTAAVMDVDMSFLDAYRAGGIEGMRRFEEQQAAGRAAAREQAERRALIERAHRDLADENARPVNDAELYGLAVVGADGTLDRGAMRGEGMSEDLIASVEQARDEIDRGAIYLQPWEREAVVAARTQQGLPPLESKAQSERDEQHELEERCVDVPEAAAEDTAATAEAAADAGHDDALAEVPFRSRLRDLERRTPSMQTRLTRLAELEEQWHGQMPSTPEERREFEQQVAAIGVGHKVLDGDRVEESMDAELYAVLTERVQQTDAANAAGERRKDLKRDLVELQEFKATRDPFGTHGTAQKIKYAEADLAFENGYIDRVKADRAAGVYASREQERDEHRDAMAAQRAAEKPTAAQKRVAAATKAIADDKTQESQFEQSKSDDVMSL